MAVQARKIQSEQRDVPLIKRGTAKEIFSTRKTISTVKTSTAREVSTRGPRYEENNEHCKKRKKDVYKASLWLNPTQRAYGKRHYIKNFDISDKAMKDSLLEQYKKA